MSEGFGEIFFILGHRKLLVARSDYGGLYGHALRRRIACHRTSVAWMLMLLLTSSPGSDLVSDIAGIFLTLVLRVTHSLIEEKCRKITLPRPKSRIFNDLNDTMI